MLFFVKTAFTRIACGHSQPNRTAFRLVALFALMFQPLPSAWVSGADTAASSPPPSESQSGQAVASIPALAAIPFPLEQVRVLDPELNRLRDLDRQYLLELDLGYIVLTCSSSPADGRGRNARFG